jgi:hypothetical protein
MTLAKTGLTGMVAGSFGLPKKDSIQFKGVDPWKR